MDIGKIIKGINSNIESEQLSAIYSIDEDCCFENKVLEKLRELTLSGSPSIREISIMRLACRIKDIYIKDYLLNNLYNEANILVFSASVRGLVCIVGDDESDRAEFIRKLTELSSRNIGRDRIQVITTALKDLEKYR